MKTKTFEELVDDKFGLYFDNSEKKEILELLQQVHEATIKECEQYVEDNPTLVLDFTRGRKIKFTLPTDRILNLKT